MRQYDQESMSGAERVNEGKSEAPDLILLAPMDGWAAPLAEVPDPVFAERMMGDGLAIDPIGQVLHAPCDGEVILLHAALHAEFSKTSIDTAIRAHRLQDQYLQLLVTGAPRFNLNGQMEGTVSDDQARRARDLLIDPVRKAGWLRRIRDGKSLNPWGRHELLASMEAKGLTPDEFALRYDLPPLGVIAHHNLAEKEQRLELEAQRRIVAEYRASGLIVKQFAESKWIRPRVLSKAVSAVAAADIEKALAATVEAQKHAALDLHSNVEPDPTAQQARHSSAPTVSVRRRRRIDPVDAVTLLARPQRSAPDRT